MTTETFTLVVLAGAAAIVAAVFSNALTRLLRIPTPALFLILAAVAAAFLPPVGAVGRTLDERVVSVALVFILFDGGAHIGWRRFRQSLGPIAWIGIAGTAVTAAALAVAAHLLFGFDWQSSLLLGAALSPTDPAVVFSVLAGREISGRSGTILQGESGANDPVGIALLLSLLAATGSGFAAVEAGVGTFVIQLVIGGVLGCGGGLLLGFILKRVRLPDEALASVFVMAAAVLLYAAGTALGGSGFLAVFIAGILTGNVRAPYKRDVDRFGSGLASLAEITVFILLGLSIRLEDVLRPDILLTGIAISALLILVVRPVFVGVLISPLRLKRGERAFVLWAGLKGAVPILLGLYILQSGIDRANEIYAIVFIVVLISVLVQGSLVPTFARLFRVPMRVIPERPWALDVRFAEEPEGLQRNVVASGSAADGSTVGELFSGHEDWISLISRAGSNLPVRRGTILQAGDVVLTQADDDAQLGAQFEPAPEVDEESPRS